MSVEERIRYLLRAAMRAEQEGAERTARALRRMAEEARPLEVSVTVPLVHPEMGCCTE